MFIERYAPVTTRGRREAYKGTSAHVFLGTYAGGKLCHAGEREKAAVTPGCTRCTKYPYVVEVAEGPCRDSSGLT